jgi:ABC-type multidrug transport system ATPase subunit
MGTAGWTVLRTDAVEDLRPGAVDEPADTWPVVAASHVTVDRGSHRLLDGVSVAVRPGQVLAVAGASGSGKTTLLRVLAHLLRPSAGEVATRPGRSDLAAGPPVAFVPQDDIVHRELTVRSTLDYAAALRLPASVPRAERRRLVSELIADLGLVGRGNVRVGALSGGQRKRVSIAVELLRRPDVLLLDEPTTGLDPPTAAGVMELLHRLAASGVAVVISTHREADIERCDRVVFLTPSGRLAYDGPVAGAMGATGARHIAEVYERLDDDRARTVQAPPEPPLALPAPGRRSVAPRRRRTGAPRQAILLARRSAEVMVRNPLTLAVLLGSPLLVTAMMATLFRSGSFDEAGGAGALQLTFWLAFAGFFFGLTYGLLQVVVERPVLERERFAGVSIGAYVVSKVLVLAPLLTAVAAVLLVTLVTLDRLPPTSPSTLAALLATLVLESLSALALGLLASAAVRDAAQATLALPMLCFPQVLFAGAVVPVVAMTLPGEAISTVLANRWGFEALGRILDLDAHGTAFSGSVVPCWAVLAGSFVLLSAATWWVLRRTTPSPAG